MLWKSADKTQMSSLDVSSQNLTSLSVPPEVTRLRCSRNKLDSLFALKYVPIVDLGVSYNHLTSLRGVPSTLRNLVAVNNLLMKSEAFMLH